jgi:hypothetical protein
MLGVKVNEFCVVNIEFEVLMEHLDISICSGERSGLENQLWSHPPSILYLLSTFLCRLLCYVVQIQ